LGGIRSTYLFSVDAKVRRPRFSASHDLPHWFVKYCLKSARTALTTWKSSNRRIQETSCDHAVAEAVVLPALSFTSHWRKGLYKFCKLSISTPSAAACLLAGMNRGWHTISRKASLCRADCPPRSGQSKLNISGSRHIHRKALSFDDGNSVI
jgi:hypothetical protein